jgi:hypothetical protein
MPIRGSSRRGVETRTRTPTRATPLRTSDELCVRGTCLARSIDILWQGDAGVRFLCVVSVYF